MEAGKCAHKLGNNGASAPSEADLSSNLSPSSTPKPTLTKTLQAAPTEKSSGGGGVGAG